MPHTSKRFNLYLNGKHLDFLSSLEGTTSEHIRRAIDEYVEKIKLAQAKLNVSISASKSQEGGAQ